MKLWHGDNLILRNRLPFTGITDIHNWREAVKTSSL